MDFATIMPVNEMSTGTNKDSGQAFLNRALEALLEMKAVPFGGHHPLQLEISHVFRVMPSNRGAQDARHRAPSIRGLGQYQTSMPV